MHTRSFTRPLLLGCLAVLWLASPALALPPLPSSFWGAATVNGAHVPDGTPVQAAIGGTVYAETHTSTFNGQSVFGLNVPGDDPTTPAIEGGHEGDVVHFLVDRGPMPQTGVWHGGTNVQNDLAGNLFKLRLPLAGRAP